MDPMFKSSPQTTAPGTLFTHAYSGRCNIDYTFDVFDDCRTWRMSVRLALSHVKMAKPGMFIRNIAVSRPIMSRLFLKLYLDHRNRIKKKPFRETCSNRNNASHLDKNNDAHRNTCKSADGTCQSLKKVQSLSEPELHSPGQFSHEH